MRTDIIDLDEINKQVETNTKNFVLECENKYKNQIEQVTKTVCNDKNIKFIFLAGPSASGKTTTSKIMANYINSYGFHALPLSLDDFFVEREETPKWDDGEFNYETADAIDWKLFGTSIKGLLAGKEVTLPTYNFTTGKKEFSGKTKLSESTIVIIEGLHALNPIISEILPQKNFCKVYISTATNIKTDEKNKIDCYNVRFFRRMIRDMYNRNTSITETINIWNKVRTGEMLYIDPYKHTAKFVINSFHAYELCVYKNVILNLQKKGVDVGNVLDNLTYFSTLSETFVPKDSVLQEFLPKK